MKTTDFSLRFLQTLLLAVVGLSLCALPLHAQSNAALVGTVKDSTGAVIPGASVTLTNLGTADKRSAVSDENGNYRFINIAPANYRLDFEQSGFKRLSREPVVVQVESTVRIDATLEIGSISEIVEVSSETPLLQTESATLGQVVEATTVQEMPINGRNVMNLIALVPGVVPQGATIGKTINSNQSAGHTNNGAFNNYQIGGGIAGHSSAYLDGAPTIGLGGNSVMLIAVQDVVQEFRVTTNNTSPEYGRFGGGVVNMATKSGTNEFHGSAYEYFRNKFLNANDFFSNLGGQERADFNQNQYGGTIGGPLRKDKTFFFFGWERFKALIGQTQVFLMPTLAQRAGDFSAFLGASTGVINPCTGDAVLAGQIFDPLTTRTVGGKTCRDPFPGNKIPANRINFTANAMANEVEMWREPNADLGLNNFINVPNAGGTQQQFNIRVDHNISEAHRFFSRFTYWRVNDIGMNRIGNVSAGSPSNQHTHQAVLGDTYSFNPTMIMENRLSFIRGYYDDLPPSLGFDLSQYGPAWASLGEQVTYPILPGPRVLGYYGGGSRGWPGMNVQSFHYRDTWALSSNLTKIAGRHTIKFGGEIRFMDYSNSSTNNASGLFDFDSGFTSVDGKNSGNTGESFASFMLGYPYAGNIGTTTMSANYSWYQGYYLADAWQVGDKLTLNYGVRWELPGAYAEKHNAVVMLLPDKKDPLADSTGLPLKGQLVLVDSPDWPRKTTQEPKYNLFVPRVGFAYRLSNSTVIRSGYGISILPMDLSTGFSPAGSDILRANTNMVASENNANLIPLNTLSSPFPAGGIVGNVEQDIIQPAGRGYDLASFAGLSPSGPVPGQPAAYVQQWNLNFQHELRSGLLVDIGYAGAKGTHMPSGSLGINQLDSQYYSMGNALKTKVPNPMAGKLNPSSAYNATTIIQGQLMRPYPQYTNLMSSAVNRGITNYHSLQVRVEKRFGDAGIIQANYTRSKSMGDVDTTMANLELRTVGGYQDYNNAKGEYSLSASDVPNRMVLSYVLQLPVGKGKKFGAGATGLVGGLISGWSVNGILNFQDGFPLSMIAQRNSLQSTFGAGIIRPNRVEGCNPVLSTRAQDRWDRWFDTSCYVQPADYTFGNVSRTEPVLRNHGVNNVDFTLSKSTAITERVKIQFKTEFFNLFNHVQFSLRDATQVGSATFGISVGQYNLPRMVQFAIRLTF